MAKYKTGNFLQLNRTIFQEKSNLSYKAKWLYTVLTEIEHRFTGEEKDYFFRTLPDLCKDSGLSKNTLIRCRKELIKIGLVKTWYAHYVQDDKKLSEKHMTTYRLA